MQFHELLCSSFLCLSSSQEFRSACWKKECFFLKERQFYEATNRHFEEILRQVRLWLGPLDERLFLEGSRQKILDAMKGQESEEKLITLLPTEKLRKKFHENIESCVIATMKEKTLSREEMEQVLVRKLLEMTNPNSEYDILLFQKVAISCKTFVICFSIT